MVYPAIIKMVAAKILVKERKWVLFWNSWYARIFRAVIWNHPRADFKDYAFYINFRLIIIP